MLRRTEVLQLMRIGNSDRTVNEIETRVLDIKSQLLEVRLRSLVKDEKIRVAITGEPIGKFVDIQQESPAKFQDFVLRIAGECRRQVSTLFGQLAALVAKKGSD